MLGSTKVTSTGFGAHHINYLEMLAVLFALKAFQVRLECQHVRVMIDNTTVVTTLAHLGTSHSVLCNNLARLMRDWCIENNI